LKELLFNLPLYIDYYTLGYPLIMSVFWIVGAVFSRFNQQQTETSTEFPEVTIVIPAYNEAGTIEETVRSLKNLTYKQLKIIVIDDCSTDQTVAKLEQVKQSDDGWPNLTILRQPENKGKAAALNRALKQITSEYMLAIDADAILEPEAVKLLVVDFLRDSRLGAVTGKPVVRNRTTLLGKIQTLEYLSIIDGIKRTQNFFLNGIMTVSGVIVMYRTSALKDAGGFNPLVMAEDIDATWSLYKAGWHVSYNCHARVFILVPERLTKLFKQRKRWATGGLEMLLDNWRWVENKRCYNYAFLLLELIFSHFWSWAFIFSTARYVSILYFSQELFLSGTVILLFISLSLILFLVGLANDKKKSYISLDDRLACVLYLLYYWLINMISSIAAQYAVFTHQTGRGRWDSPDRGI